MTHTIIYNSELHIIESKLQRDMTLDEVDEIITKTAKIAKEKDCILILNDFREVSRKLPLWQIYELPDRIRRIFTSFGMNVWRYKRANVVTKDWDEYILQENVMVNRGQKEKVFADIDPAKKWLLVKEGSTQSNMSLQWWILPT